MGTVTVRIWHPSPFNGKTGHVALKTNSRYVSFYPRTDINNGTKIVAQKIRNMRNFSGENKSREIEDRERPIRREQYRQQLISKRFSPPEIEILLKNFDDAETPVEITFTDLDEEKINNAINRLDFNSIDWNILGLSADLFSERSHNCSSIVLALLKTGGIKKYIGEDQESFQTALDIADSPIARAIITYFSLSMASVPIMQGFEDGMSAVDTNATMETGSSFGGYYGGFFGKVGGALGGGLSSFLVVAPTITTGVLIFSGPPSWLASGVIYGATALGAYICSKMGEGVGTSVGSAAGAAGLTAAAAGTYGSVGAALAGIKESNRLEDRGEVISPYVIQKLAAYAQAVEAKKLGQPERAFLEREEPRYTLKR